MDDHQPQTATLTLPSPLRAPPHALPAEAVLEALASDGEQGLASARVAEQRARHGYNELAEAEPVPLWRKFLGQFAQLVIWILILAAVISGLLGEWADASAILAIVLLNALLGFFQEEKAERALAALRWLSAPLAKVIRDGALQTVPARELVPGDCLDLEAGDNIPTDARLIEAFDFRTQEAALTGESTPVEKDAAGVLGEAASLADRRNMVYLGTVAAAGKAKAVVVATGMHTELGRIAGLLQRYEPEPTPLQRRLAELGKVLVFVCLAVVGLVFLLEWWGGTNLLDVFLLSVSLAVAAVPEGLPAVVTVALALGLQRMVKRNALIRKLPGVETLGSVTVICSDKTGTLTCNEMTVREIVAGGEHYQVTGAGYAPRGQLLKCRPGAARPREVVPQPLPDGRKGSRAYEPTDPRTEDDLVQALKIAAFCNNAQVRPRGDGSETWEVIGDPTEGALLVAALKAGVEADKYPHHVLYKIPFDSERKAMSVVVREAEGPTLMYTKGAPEVVLSRCTAELRAGRVEPLTEARRKDLLRVNAEMASRALRVLALAYRPCPEPDASTYEEAGLVFAGLAGMIDPPREEVKEAVRKCREAGIRPVMITGDHPATALAVARELGIAAAGDQALTGQELNALSEEKLAERVEEVAVYARVSAEHKLRVVRAWKARGQVVAMTGDGVNDAPAVKAADIGIAMGLTGTDVTKEASDMVLTDDNFASIVNAIEEGRGIYDNIQKVLLYLLSCNAGEILFLLVASLLGWPLPLVPIQLLWLNLVTDGLPALALAMEPPERDVMRRRPRSPRDPVLTAGRGGLMLLFGLLMATAATVGFAFVYEGTPDNLPRARAVAFCTLVFTQLFFAFACRSQRYTLPQLGLFSNPYLFAAVVVSGLLQLGVVSVSPAQQLVDAVSHLAWEWGLLFGLALLPVTVVEVTKLIRAARAPGGQLPPD